MRYGIEREEWWPVLELRPVEDRPELVTDVPDELIERYRAALKEWNAVQDAISALPEWAAYYRQQAR